jgi:septal ring factor EnvC (AmiA/AmiB activator)
VKVYVKAIRFILIIFLFSSIKVWDQTSKKGELIKEKTKIEAEIELVNKLLEDTRSKKENTVNEFKLLNRKISNRSLMIRKLNNELVLINDEIKENEKTLDLYRKDLIKAKSEYSNLIYYAFKSSNHNLNFMYLLASKNINQFYLRLKYLQQYKDYRVKQINLINRLNVVIEEKIVDLNEIKKEKVNLINRKLIERANLKGEIEEADRIIYVLKGKETELESDLEKKKRIAAKLDKEIESIIKEESRKNRFASLTPEDRIISDDFAKNKGVLPWPTKQGVITEFFGENEYADMKNLKVRNNGIDITTVGNSYIRAIFKGEVSAIFVIKGTNSTVLIRHGNYFTVYHNLVNVRVKVGDKIETKEIIGNVYQDKNTGESIVHFEIWKETDLMNPVEWLSN